MAPPDWARVDGGLAPGSEVIAGITSGRPMANGGGDFCFQIRSLDAIGSCALACAVSGFDPFAKGGETSAALCADLGVASFVYFCAQGTTINMASFAYVFGIATDGRLTLAKQRLDGSSSTVLVKEETGKPPGTWRHVRLEVVCNPNGDAALNVWESDLARFTLAAPNWAPLPGFAVAPTLVDDLAGVRTGSLPFVGGRTGFGATFTGARQEARFDHVRPRKQL